MVRLFHRVRGSVSATASLASPYIRIESERYLPGSTVNTDRETWCSVVPVISTFFGTVVRMFYREHGIPHFHAEYQGQHATFTFDGKILAGTIRSRTARSLIKEWSLARSTELEANWRRGEAGEPLERIAPLK